MENALEKRSRVLRQKKSLKRKREKSGKIVESQSGNREVKVQQENNKKRKEEPVRTFERM